MLRDDFKRFRERPAPAVLALLVATLVGLFGGLAIGGDDESAAESQTITFSAESDPSATPATGAVVSETAALREQLLEATQRGVAKAESDGDRAAAVVWPTGWSKPIVVAGHAPASGQMWSLSKPVTAIAGYNAALKSTSGVPSKGLRTGINDAIRRSDNCGQRRVALGLQELAGGTQAQAIAAFGNVLKEGDSGANTAAIKRARETAASADCALYFKDVAPLPGATELGPAVQFGTAQWTTVQAAAFAHALASGTYGDAGEYVLDLMTQTKLAPRTDTNKNPLVPKDLDWGAGNAFAGRRPAYKSGWGGKATQNFAVTQLVVVRGVEPTVAIAAVVYPKKPVTDEDPEKTTAPSGLEAIFTDIRTQLEGWVALQ